MFGRLKGDILPRYVHQKALSCHLVLELVKIEGNVYFVFFEVYPSRITKFHIQVYGFVWNLYHIKGDIDRFGRSLLLFARDEFNFD